MFDPYGEFHSGALPSELLKEIKGHSIATFLELQAEKDIARKLGKPRDAKEYRIRSVLRQPHEGSQFTTKKWTEWTSMPLKQSIHEMEHKVWEYRHEHPLPRLHGPPRHEPVPKPPKPQRPRRKLK
ncbi:MAG: hypothetical protein HY917_00735 [Candidatus Diapherotrites archaeon]|nr:hypothetical protein [Candidatus Diapherotrites archaeon]